MNEIKAEDRAYFAGLFDGEGCVLISKSAKASSRSISYNLMISFSITYKQVLLEMQKCFGGNIHIRNMEKLKNCTTVQKTVVAGISSPENWKQLYSYHLCGREALYFLKVIEPFCREKKEQAALGIRYEQGRRPHAGCGGRSERETERCEFFFQELRRMKHEQSEDESNVEVDFEDEQQTLCCFEAEP